MQDKNPYGKKNEIYGFETLYREIGYYVSRIEHYERSLKFFDEAIKKTPDDTRALVGRSKARAKSTQYEGALEDINHALNLNPDDLLMLAHKALDTYLCCEFEEGLVQNTRLLPRRQKPEHFKMGVMHCTDAIENCVGDRTGRPLRDHFRIIRRLAWKRNYAAQKPFEPTPKGKQMKKKMRFQELFRKTSGLEPVQPKDTKAAKSHINVTNLEIKESLHSKESDREPIPPYTQPFPFKPLQNYSSNIENYMAEKYLDKMYLDKIYLKHIKSVPGVNCPNEKGSQKLRQIARNCYKTVSYKQELLRTRRPFYFIKYQEAKVSGSLKERQKIELQHQQNVSKKEADALLQKLQLAQSEKRLKDVLILVEKLKRYCDGKPRKLLPEKSIYMNAIYDTVCESFYDLYRLNPDQGIFDQNRRLYATLGLPLSREPSKDSVVAQFKNVFIDYRRQIQEFEDRVKNAVLAEELCWFYHELSRLHLEQKQFDLARVYAKKCIQIATNQRNEKWILNSAMLMCKSNMQQHNKNDARANLQQAMRSAEKLKDNEKLEYLEKCMGVVDSVEFDDIFGLKELEKRECKIIQMMASSKMKDEVAHLFRQMAAMPASRRMTVIPGVRVSKKDTKQMKGRAMSILPGQRDQDSMGDLKKTASSTDTSKKGKDLMNLIDLHL